MKRHFYFFRHGQRNGVDEESTLNEEGVAQVKKLAGFLADKNIEVAYSSPLRRSIDTAKGAVNNNPEVEVITDDRLIETAFGFWYAKDDPKQQRINQNFNRIKSCLDDIVAHDNHTNIMVASHGGVTRALCWACGKKVGDVHMAHCFHFTLENEQWTFIETFDSEFENSRTNH